MLLEGAMHTKQSGQPCKGSPLLAPPGTMMAGVFTSANVRGLTAEYVVTSCCFCSSSDTLRWATIEYRKGNTDTLTDEFYLQTT